MSSDEEIRYLPVAPSEGEARIAYASGNIEGIDLDSDRGEHEIALEKGDDHSYPMQMILPIASDKEHITRGVESIDAWEKMTQPDFYGEEPDNSYDWVLKNGEGVNYDESEEINEKTARDVLSPGYDEMEELREETAEKLDQVDTEAEKRQIIEDAWEEAAEMDLEGANRKF